MWALSMPSASSSPAASAAMSFERVGNIGLAPFAHGLHGLLKVGMYAVPFLGKADIAIVEPDEAKPGADQALPKFIRPGGHLAAEAVDHQEWNAVRRTCLVEFQFYPVGANFCHFLLLPYFSEA